MERVIGLLMKEKFRILLSKLMKNYTHFLRSLKEISLNLKKSEFIILTGRLKEKRKKRLQIDLTFIYHSTKK
jgi:hypothetical protein